MQNSTATFLFGASALIAGYLAYRKELDGGVSVSAPGKALIAGGYLVLKEPNVGVVVSCTSRFFATVKICEIYELGSGDENEDGDKDAKKEKGEDLLGMLQGDEVLVAVLSPQFCARFCFAYNLHTNTVRQIVGKSNEFVQTCLELVFSFSRKSKNARGFEAEMRKLSSNKKVFGIKLRADNDFYSQTKMLLKQGMPLTTKSLASLPSFLACPINHSSGAVEVAKTGMGSSAALTTSLVGALLKHLKIINLGTDKTGLLGVIEKCIHSLSYMILGEGIMSSNTADAYGEDRRIVHNLAQVAHCVAQGKIGSGFDVAAAVYGTQTYARFPKHILDPVFENRSVESVYNAVMDREMWTQVIQPLNLPKGFDIVMGDVCGGSESASMAKAVLKWKESGLKAESLWNELGDTNRAIHEKLRVLPSMELNFPSAFRSVVIYVANTSPTQWTAEDMHRHRHKHAHGGGTSSSLQPSKAIGLSSEKEIVHSKDMEKILMLLMDIKKLFQGSQALLKRVGEAAGVGVQPDNQTLLVMETDKVAGVLGAGVPGAGGEDAVFALTVSASSRAKVEAMWSQWHHTSTSRGDGTGTHSGGSGRVQRTVCPMLLHAETNKVRAGVRNEVLSWK